MLVLCAVYLAMAQGPSASAYEDQISAWRTAHEADLKKEDGYLALGGLFWLHDGQNSFGTDASNDLKLPANSAPAKAGSFELHSGKVTMHVADGVTATEGPKTITNLDMKSDVEGNADRVSVNALTFMIIQRARRIGVRMWDKNAPSRTAFSGEKWYPIDPAYKITAKFVAYPHPKSLTITNIIGDSAPVSCPGYVVFTLAGKECRLEAQGDGSSLFFNFKDSTSGQTTDPAGRFLYTGGPKDGQVVLDFNRAENPPCAFTNYATCPLPPRSNFMTVPVPAGEMNYQAGPESGHAR